MPTILQFIIILLASTVLAVVVCRLLRLPPILGYLLVGIVVGPHALAWIPDSQQTHYLAELGVVFLMFSIGLEFSLTQLRVLRRSVFGLGSAQVGITVLASVVFMQLIGFSWQMGLVLGGALAMSSTAIVSKMLTEKNELAASHGRDVFGILLFQDIAVVPFLIVIPALASGAESLWLALAEAAVKVAIVLFIILVLGQPLMRRWFHLVARLRSNELFMLNVLLITLGLAGLTQLAGLSLPLGAFLAGMLIAETEYRYRVEEDIRPFRDVLLGVFFISLGMQLDPRVVVIHIEWLLLALFIPVLAKLALIVLLAKAFGRSWPVSLRIGFYLAQAGEFALVLLALGSEYSLLHPAAAQIILAAMLLSMLSAPLIIHYADYFVRRLTANDWLARAAELTQIAARAMGRQDHVIICGYGRSGQNLSRILEQEDIGYVALDFDPGRVREAAADGSTVVYGDAGRREALVAAGLYKARALVITFADVPAALRILDHAHAVRPDLPVIVRTVDDTELDKLQAAGAAEVVPEVLEGSLMLASHSLLLLGVPLNRVLQRIRQVREERYSLFRGFFRGATDHAHVAESQQPRLHSVLVTEGAYAIGKSIGTLALDGLVEVTGIRRRGARMRNPDQSFTLEPGDVVILLGRPENLALAEQRFLQG